MNIGRCNVGLARNVALESSISVRGVRHLTVAVRLENDGHELMNSRPEGRIGFLSEVETIKRADHVIYK